MTDTQTRQGSVSAADNVLVVSNLRTTLDRGKGRLAVVDGVSFSVPRGKTLGIVGESGSGKSMTAMSIMRLLEPPARVARESEIHFDGKNLATLSDRALRKIRGAEIAMVFQEPMTSLNPLQTVGAQISESLRLHRKLSRAQAREQAIDMLRAVEIASPEERVDEYPHQMSGGMRQRVMIAMALACQPTLLIADEPTTALDVTIQAQILDLLRKTSLERGMSLVLITHDLGVVAEMCDEVAVMYAGKIVEQGPVAEIFRDPKHPYTRALMQSMPVLGATKETPLSSIPGTVPDLDEMPTGCRFAARCEFARDVCLGEEPPLFGSVEHRSACWMNDPEGRWER